MKHGRSVVAGVDPGPDGVGHRGFAQVALAVALADALVDRGLQVAADQVHVLPDLQEHDGEAGVLAQGHVGVTGETGVLEQLSEDVLARLGLLAFGGLLEERHQIVPQIGAGLHGQLGHRLGYPGDVQFPHDRLPPFPPAMSAAARVSAQARGCVAANEGC